MCPMNFNTSVWSLCLCYGRISRLKVMFGLTAYFRPPFQYSLSTSSRFFSSSSFSLTLGPNELCSLVVIGGQMCCRSCQCSGSACDANTHKLTHRGPLPAHQNGNDAQVSLLSHPTLISLASDCPVPSCSFSFSSPRCPAGISSEAAQCRALRSAQGPLDA